MQTWAMEPEYCSPTSLPFSFCSLAKWPSVSIPLELIPDNPKVVSSHHKEKQHKQAQPQKA